MSSTRNRLTPWLCNWVLEELRQPSAPDVHHPPHLVHILSRSGSFWMSQNPRDEASLTVSDGGDHSIVVHLSLEARQLIWKEVSTPCLPPNRDMTFYNYSRGSCGRISDYHFIPTVVAIECQQWTSQPTMKDWFANNSSTCISPIQEQIDVRHWLQPPAMGDVREALEDDNLMDQILFGVEDTEVAQPPAEINGAKQYGDPMEQTQVDPAYGLAQAATHNANLTQGDDEAEDDAFMTISSMLQTQPEIAMEPASRDGAKQEPSQDSQEGSDEAMDSAQHDMLLTQPEAFFIAHGGPLRAQEQPVHDEEGELGLQTQPPPGNTFGPRTTLRATPPPVSTPTATPAIRIGEDAKIRNIDDRITLPSSNQTKKRNEVASSYSYSTPRCKRTKILTTTPGSAQSSVWSTPGNRRQVSCWKTFQEKMEDTSVSLIDIAMDPPSSGVSRLARHGLSRWLKRNSTGKLPTREP